MPDRNAAAQRVVNIAKALREMGHDVLFMNALKDNVSPCWTEYFGFSCYEFSKKNKFKYLTGIREIKKIIREKKIDLVIAYNYPAIALNKLVRFCKNNRIRIIGDVTEWYVAKGNFIFRLIKNFDSNLRMKKIHPKMDGIIAISEFLFQNYKTKVPTISP